MKTEEKLIDFEKLDKQIEALKAVVEIALQTIEEYEAIKKEYEFQARSYEEYLKNFAKTFDVILDATRAPHNA